MSDYPQPDIYARSKIKFAFDLSNFTTKSEVKNQQVLIHQILLKKIEIATSKLDVDKKNIDKLKTVLTDLRKLSNVVNNDDVKKQCMINPLEKLNAINGIDTYYNTKIKDIDEKFLIKVNILEPLNLINFQVQYLMIA